MATLPDRPERGQTYRLERHPDADPRTRVPDELVFDPDDDGDDLPWHAPGRDHWLADCDVEGLPAELVPVPAAETAP